MNPKKAKELLESIKQEKDNHDWSVKVLDLKHYFLELMDENGIENNTYANPIRWHQLHKLLKIADGELKELILLYADTLGIYVHPSIKKD